MSNIVALDRTRRIRVLNDNFRTTFIGGQVVISAGVADLPLDVRARVMLRVQRFCQFDADNDPYEEHDFGSFELAGETFFWKIDYCDLLYVAGPEDPADPNKSTRVLTIMLSVEY
jgi:hypothetical protein